MNGWIAPIRRCAPALASILSLRIWSRSWSPPPSNERTIMHAPDDYKGLKLKLDGLVPPGQGFHRNLLFDAMYASLPRDPQVKVQIYNAEIVPGGFTNWHCHNGAAFFVALQGLFEAHFQEGVLVKAKAGDCYSEPIAKFHRGHNPHPEPPYLCVGLCFTSPDREHVTNSVERPW